MRHVEVTQNRNPSFRLGAVLNFISTSRVREHALHKCNRISEYLRGRNVKIEQSFSVHSTISLAQINSLEMCNLHCDFSFEFGRYKTQVTSHRSLFYQYRKYPKHL